MVRSGDLDDAAVGGRAVAPGRAPHSALPGVLRGTADEGQAVGLDAGRAVGPVRQRYGFELSPVAGLRPDGYAVLPLGRDLVQPAGEPLGLPAAVREDDGRPVLLDEIDDALLDRRPDRGLGLGACGRSATDRAGRLAERGHVLDGDDDLDLDRLGARGLHHHDLAGTAQEPGDLVHRTDGGREPDPLCRGVEQLVEPFERQREVGAALGARHRVDLVHDHGLHASQRLTGGAGQYEEQRLRGGDEDVRRHLVEAATLIGRRVARADADRDVRYRQVKALRRLPDAGQGGPEVALDVDGQCLQRADVEDPAPVPRLLRHGGGGEPVERPEEGRQGLAASGGSDDEGVTASGDGVPRTLLRRRRALERTREPRLGSGGEPLERAHRTIIS